MELQRSPDGLTFKTVVMNFLYRLSEMTSVADDWNYSLDTLWSLLENYLTEDDHDEWERHSTGMDYASSMQKIRIIMLVLYRNGVLPYREINNRKYKLKITGEDVKLKKGMTSHIVDDIELTQFLFRHMLLLSYQTKNQMDNTIHLDALWFILSPYITQEDFYNWDRNNKTYGNPEDHRHNPYKWNIVKGRIVVTVMNRANFLWKSAVIDAPVQRSKGGDVDFRSKTKQK